MSNKEMICNLIKNRKAESSNYNQFGIIGVNLKKLSGLAGTDVNYAIISEKEIEITYGNTHYGYGHFDENGNIIDNSNRSLFEII